MRKQREAAEEDPLRYASQPAGAAGRRPARSAPRSTSSATSCCGRPRIFEDRRTGGQIRLRGADDDRPAAVRASDCDGGHPARKDGMTARVGVGPMRDAACGGLSSPGRGKASGCETRSAFSALGRIGIANVPAVGALRIPGDIGIAESQRPLGRVPRHPAIGLAIEHHEPCPVAAGRLRETAPQIILGRRRQRSVAGVGQPDAARDVESRLVAPDRAVGQVRRLRRARQHIDEDAASSRARSPRRVGRDARARRRACRHRRTIIFGAITVGFGDGVVLRATARSPSAGASTRRRKRCPHGDFAAASAPIG